MLTEFNTDSPIAFPPMMVGHGDPFASYAGVGARATPPTVCQVMTRIAGELAGRDLILRTGGAPGADEAFLAGVGDTGNAEVWLPWQGFNNHQSYRPMPSQAAYELAAKFHPMWSYLSRSERALHARNGHVVLGEDLATPVRFLLCWTPFANGSGGTGQAIRVAIAHGIPVFDLASTDPLFVFDVAMSVANRYAGK